jgi:hypothetical protein
MEERKKQKTSCNLWPCKKEKKTLVFTSTAATAITTTTTSSSSSSSFFLFVCAKSQARLRSRLAGPYLSFLHMCSCNCTCLSTREIRRKEERKKGKKDLFPFTLAES